MREDPSADGLQGKQKWLAIATVIVGLAMAVMDGSIANISLPTIAREVHAYASASIWVVNAYQIAVAVCLLPLAALGEVIGYRRVYLSGLMLFALASLACGASHSLPQLAVARTVQGIGAAGIVSVNMALVRFIYPARLLGRAIGINAFIVGSATAVGPSVAGFILAIASWHWLFLLNVPLGAAALAMGWRSLPVIPLAKHRFDGASAVLCAATVGLFLATVNAFGHRQAAWLSLGGAAATGFAAWRLLRRQSAQAPILPVDLLRIPIFTLSIGTSVCSFAAQMAAFVALPFYFENVAGKSASQTGLLMTAWPVAVALMAPLAGRLSDRVSAGLLGGAGLAVFALGLFALVNLPASTSDAGIVLRLALCGVGFGLFQSPNNRTLIGAAPRSRTGAASGMLGTARLIGQTGGAAFVAYALHDSAVPPAFVLVVAGLLACCACAVSLLRITQGAASSA